MTSGMETKFGERRLEETVKGPTFFAKINFCFLHFVVGVLFHFEYFAFQLSLWI